MAELVWLVIALPLAGTVLLHFFGRRLGDPLAGWVASGAVGTAFLVAALASWGFLQGSAQPRVVDLFAWIPALGARAELLWDPLAALMTLIVTGVGTLIHLYSIGYMHGDPRFGRYFTYLNLFATSMLVLVLAGNFAVLFLGWELVGLCSYLLISFWFTRPPAAAAGKKAFLVNRIGDFGFMVGIMLIFASFGTLSYVPVFEQAAAVLTAGTATAITLLLLAGATGKSAQLPLYVWLPDAMEGPTPVSALIHAATMVTAGVYMVARTAPLFALAPFSSAAVATVGAVTALAAAGIALAQTDIKRLLAYSTISQLGYMFLAVGAAAYVAGVFHLMTHAFFKALLFLGAGSVMHAMAGEQRMHHMGGLRRALPVTFATVAVAWLAISGIPPLAGFWSKDEILAATFARGGWYLALWALALLTALLTALYMTRWLVLIFLGRPRWEEGQIHPHESPPVMARPLVALAALSVVGGLVNTPFRTALDHFLEPSFGAVQVAHPPEGVLLWVLSGLSVLAGVAGIAIAWLIYSASPQARAGWLRRLGGPWRWLQHGYYVDELYGNLLVLPSKLAAAWSAFVLDQRFIDGAVNGVGAAVRRMGAALRPVQSGFVRNYGLVLMAGVVGLMAWFLSRGAL
ncbi:MAG: NADH-quinone oxidoreductase subunit L [Actinomycetota bacterium]|nr:NADH-quinone oxidoreductase subunit L [Actinomycetota bacterium]